MTPRQASLLKRLAALVAIALPAIGWAFTSGIGAVDRRYVHQVQYERHLLVDSIRQAETQGKLDEIILRVQQLQCGQRITAGCR
jgi:hypothetical protein